MKEFLQNMNNIIGAFLLISGFICLILVIWEPIFIQIVFGLFTGAIVFFLYGKISHVDGDSGKMEKKEEK